MDIKNIINIKNINDINKYSLDKPIYKNNYLFHYLIEFNNLNALKLKRFPIHIENNDRLNGFFLAAKYNNIDILLYLINNYPEYIYNTNINNNLFTYYLDPKYIITILDKYPNLDWDKLLLDASHNSDILLKKILTNTKFKNLIRFLKNYKLKLHREQYLLYLFDNKKLKNKYIIKLLNYFTDNEINLKSSKGVGLLLSTIRNNNYEIFDYLLKRNIDYDYSTYITQNTPFKISVIVDIFNNKELYSKILLEKKILTFDFHDDNLNNILHIILYIRTNRSISNIYNDVNKSNEFINNININRNIDINIFNKATNEMWNQNNIHKLSPLELLTELNYDIYSSVIINNKISILSNIREKIKKKKLLDLRWLELYLKMSEYTVDNDINFKNYKYRYTSLFDAKFTDLCLYCLHLDNKYNELYIPNIKSIQLQDVDYNNNIFDYNNILLSINEFPWIITYNSENDYFIHPYLNNLINSISSDKFKYGIIFICISDDYVSHANVLIYDFINKTIERFEPYGNYPYKNIDDILEEELTWNTEFTYIKPSEYLPSAGFQTISNEENKLNMKKGDIGGYCLAWCLWYVESKLINPNINSKILVIKLINKLNSLNISFKEYIRNYSYQIYKKIIKYMKDIQIDKTVTNSYYSFNNNIKLLQYFINKFNN